MTQAIKIGNPYKALLPPRLVISMALLYLPRDGTEWLPLLKNAHKALAESFLIGSAADIPSKVAQCAFESMGYQYMEVENGEWRRSLSSKASKHWSMFLEYGEVNIQ